LKTLEDSQRIILARKIKIFEDPDKKSDKPYRSVQILPKILSEGFSRTWQDFSKLLLRSL